MRRALIDRARTWIPGKPERGKTDCSRALDRAAAAAAALQAEPLASANARVRQFRTRRLAHHLFDNTPDALPLFSDLFCLADASAEFVRHAALAVTGLDRDYADEADKKKGAADRFWRVGLAALMNATDVDGNPANA